MDIKDTDDNIFSFSRSKMPSNLKNLFDEIIDDGELPGPSNQQNNISAESAAATAAAWNLEVAEVVTAFKNSAPSGRVGIALLTSPELNFKIIIYRNKSNVLGTFTLQEAHLYRRSSYLQFYDDSGSYWSILFDPGKENEFLKKIPKNYASVSDVKNDKTKENIAENEPKGQQKQQVIECTVPKNEDDLLSVAKLGQPLTVTSDMSDSSDTEVIKTPLPGTHSKAIATRKVQKFSSDISPQTCITANVFSTPAHIPMQQMQDSHFMNMILCENRTQNTELRMNMSKLELKIEKILDKMDSMGASGSNAAAVPAATVANKKEDDIIQLEETILELKKENRKLRQLSIPSNDPTMFAFLDKHLERLQKFGIPSNECDKIEEHFEKILVELIQLVEQKNKDMLVNEKHKLNCEKEKDDIRVKYEKSLDEVLELKGSFLKESQKCEKLVSELADAQVKLKSDNKLDLIIKDIMNRLYGSIYEDLQGLSTSTANFTADQVLRILGSAIRRETMEAINMAKTSNIKLN